MSPSADSQRQRKFLRGAVLRAADLLLHEAFQISCLPGWVPDREFAAVLHAYPYVATYLRKRQPASSREIDISTIRHSIWHLDSLRAHMPKHRAAHLVEVLQ